ncbi:MAG: NAD(P)-dependent oxidoreductase [Acidimicrobiales bacterium]|jgi:phosphoglycerate dehydrogenase-like enzyme|nr:NAD(P)-dependent oxidoreductase [Acidimicrobiales bacterium]
MPDSPIIWFDRRPVPELAELAPPEATIEWPESDDPLDGIDRADGVIAGASIIYDRDVFSLATKLRVLVRAGIGFDNIVLSDATAAGVAACNTPDGPTISTAEHALALIFSVTKGLKQSENRLQRQEGNYGPNHNALELDGARLTLIGLGRIGSRVAKVATAAGIHVTAYDPFESDERFEALGVTRSTDLGEAVSEAQIVSIHAPLSPQTRHLVDSNLIGGMRDGVFIVNTARGGLIDDDALLEALDSGKVGGAGLDVTEPEPLPSGHALLEHESVLVTPHVASATTAGRNRIFTMALDQVVAALAGIKPSHILNPEVWPGRNSNNKDA